MSVETLSGIVSMILKHFFKSSMISSSVTGALLPLVSRRALYIRTAAGAFIPKSY